MLLGCIPVETDMEVAPRDTYGLLPCPCIEMEGRI